MVITQKIYLTDLSENSNLEKHVGDVSSNYAFKEHEDAGQYGPNENFPEIMQTSIFFVKMSNQHSLWSPSVTNYVLGYKDVHQYGPHEIPFEYAMLQLPCMIDGFCYKLVEVLY